ncbi:MAG: hypothetical protein FD123_3278 [Bacteroidetes bacterium]|nr:MAG: hypothetical protein FD123_3278 [Bacteroidota bacterium]
MKTRFLLLVLPLVLFACKGKKSSTYTPPKTDTIVQAPPKPGLRNDMKVTLHEESLNKVFKALGDISGTEPYKLLLIKGTYTWTLKNPRIRLKPGKADFVTDVNVRAGSLEYSTLCAGDVKVWYDGKNNKINVKITKALIEIYTYFMGRKVSITEVDLASHFPDPFSFDGPATMETDMDFTMPDNSVRKIYMKTTDCDVIVEDHFLSVPCEVEFYQKPVDKKATTGGKN